jgi:hypothetical protein
VLAILSGLAFGFVMASVSDVSGSRASQRAAQVPEPVSLLVADQALRAVQVRSIIFAAVFGLLAVIFGRYAFPLGLTAADGMIYFMAATGMRRATARPGAVAGIRGRSLSILADGREPSLVVTHRLIAAARRKALPEARASA